MLNLSEGESHAVEFSPAFPTLGVIPCARTSRAHVGEQNVAVGISSAQGTSGHASAHGHGLIKEIRLAGRGHQTFKKRQKEQQRKDRQQAKMERRIQRKSENENRERSGPEMGEPVEPLAQSGISYDISV